MERMRLLCAWQQNDIFDCRALRPKFLGHFLRRLADDLKASNKCAPQRLVRDEFISRQAARLSDQVVCLHQDMAKAIKRLEGHPEPRREFAVR